MIIVEFFAGPGSGKTSISASMFAAFKRGGIDCEFSREYAQEAIYEHRKHLLDFQIVIAANQYRKYKELQLAGTQILFSDTSLLFSKIYGRDDLINAKLCDLMGELYKEFRVIKVFVRRVKPFSQQGRVHTEEESKALDGEIERLFGPFDFIVDGSEEGADELFEPLKQRITNENIRGFSL